MLKLYTWKTPNGYKIPIMLEELSLSYEIIPIDINNGGQMTSEFLAMNPNHKIPVLVDENAEGGPITIFESGAILMYLGEKHGTFFPQGTKEKYQTIEWLMFQIASVGPMFGQANHFVKHTHEKIVYAIERYRKEANRLMGVMNSRLSHAEFLAGDYSIADMATWPWIRSGIANKHIELGQFPHVEKWFRSIESRAAVARALARVDSAVKGGPAVCMPDFDQKD